MIVGELSPWLVRSALALAGAGAGVLAGRLADLLPGRYDITLVAAGTERARRNAALVVLAVAFTVGLAEVLLAQPARPLGEALPELATDLVLGAALLASAAVDLEHMILPDEITYGGALLGLATAYLRPVGLVPSIVGAFAGFLVSYVPFLLYKLIRGRSGMGLGDAKLLVMLGAWLGWQGALFAMFAGAVQSTLAAIVLRVARVPYRIPASVAAEIEELRARAAEGDEEAKAELADDPMAADVGDGLLATRLPLGPFLALAALEALFARREVQSIFAWILAG